MPAILIVDDDRAIQEMLRDLLQDCGYTVLACKTGTEALTELNQHHFDAVLLDVLLPQMNGFKLLDLLRANPRTHQIPIVMMSGIYRSRNHKKDMKRQYDIVDYLDKPLQTERLLHQLHAIAPAPKPNIAQTEPVLLEKPKMVVLTQRKDTQDKVDARLVDAQAESERAQVETDAHHYFRKSVFVKSGTVDTTSIANLFAHLWHERATGALLLRHEQVKKIAYFRDGNAYTVKSNRVSECLGQILVRERLIRSEECVRSIETMRQSGRKQGEILVEMGAITQRNLEFALDLQLETKLFEIFQWTSGQYRFNSSVELPNEERRFEWQGASVIVEGIRRTYDETRLRKEMVPVLDVPLLLREKTTDWSQLGLRPTEALAAASIRNGKTTRELLDLLALDPPDSLRLIYTLIALEFIAARH